MWSKREVLIVICLSLISTGMLISHALYYASCDDIWPAIIYALLSTVFLGVGIKIFDEYDETKGDSENGR